MFKAFDADGGIFYYETEIWMMCYVEACWEEIPR